MTDSTASTARLLRGGTVLTSDPAVPDLLPGDVLVGGQEMLTRTVNHA